MRVAVVLVIFGISACTETEMKGKVTNPANSPLEHVVIYTDSVKTVTGADGTFRIAPVSPGEPIIFTAEGRRADTIKFENFMSGREILVVLEAR